MSLRVTMVLGSLSRRAGGLFESVRHLSLALSRAGLDVRVIGLRDDDTERDLPAWAPLRPVALGTLGPSAVGLAPQLRGHLAGSDVIHQHGIWQAFGAVTASLARSVPTVISPRGMLDPWALRASRGKKGIAWTCWERANLSRAACIHALAAAEESAVRDLLPNVRIATIPNGAAPALRRHAPSGPARTCLFMGRLHPKKGLEGLLRDWAAMPAALRAAWRLDIAGPDRGGMRNGLAAQAEALGIAPEVRFVGPLFGAAKSAALARASAFVLPSLSEGLPMAVLEAWSAGVPVLMTRACNLPEGFAAGAAHEIGAPGSLAAGLARPDLAEMGVRGQALVRARFDWDQIAARHAALYAWAAERGPQPAEVAA